MKVTNLANNQVQVTTDDGTKVFSSYGTTIAKVDSSGVTTLDTAYWNYSATTTKYLSRFLGVSSKDIKKRVAGGTYVLTDLNS